MFPLIALLFGIVEFSRLYSLQLRIQQAAREGAREVALHYDDPGWSIAEANAVIDGLVGAGINRTIIGCATPEDDTTVTLTAQVDLVIPQWGGSGGMGPVDVAARARMPCEG
jgi:Flp pilus assembly protein TadG